MGITLGSNFDMQAALPLDSRETVADITARDAIPLGVRWEGMIVYVAADEKHYGLKGGITNGDWAGVGGADPTDYTYIGQGDETTDGSWRFTVVSGNLEMQKRISGVWTVSSQFTDP